ncbi:MAG: hypothetical protein HY689_04700 [Chloroflexi bacterium]|nr:hypothetical protein [Chloroflexota bacterium]
MITMAVTMLMRRLMQGDGAVFWLLGACCSVWRLRPRRAPWEATALLLGMGLLAGCTPGPRPPEILGPTAWRLTLSPIEPAAGIPAEVTMQRMSEDAQPLRATPDAPAPYARARELTSDLVIWSEPARVDGRGVWVAPITFPMPGRWQIVLHEAIDPTLPVRGNGWLPWPSVERFGPQQVVRDAIGREELSLLITVIPDRGPILWWLRTHLLEVFGVAIVLTASVVSYLLRNRMVVQRER